jgi:hypothetical protein
MAAYQTLGLVWFDKNQSQQGGPYHQDWRIEDSPQARVEFQLGISGLNLVRP